jgi:hypothetical protein
VVKLAPQQQERVPLQRLLLALQKRREKSRKKDEKKEEQTAKAI